MYISVTYKRLWYGQHARLRLRLRGIRRGEVRWLVAKGLPFSVETYGARQKRFGREGIIRGRMARVIYIESATAIEIITVHWEQAQ